MRLWKELTKGIIRENPTLVILIGLCPTLAITTSISNAIGMGIAASFVLVLSNIIISLIKNLIPGKIRIPCYIVVMAALVGVVQMVMAAYFPDLNERLGIFIPLIVVNCIILGRAEAFAGKNTVLPSTADGIGMGIGLTLALFSVAFVREILSGWSLGGVPISENGIQPMAVMGMAPGAFIVLAVILSIMNITVNVKRPYESEDLVAKEKVLFAAAKPSVAKLAKKEAGPASGGGA